MFAIKKGILVAIKTAFKNNYKYDTILSSLAILENDFKLLNNIFGPIFSDLEVEVTRAISHPRLF